MRKEIVEMVEEMIDDILKVQKDTLVDIIDAFMTSNPKSALDYLETLNSVATLMNELESGRFKGASYSRNFHHDRLHISVKLEKGK